MTFKYQFDFTFKQSSSDSEDKLHPTVRAFENHLKTIFPLVIHSSVFGKQYNDADPEQVNRVIHTLDITCSCSAQTLQSALKLIDIYRSIASYLNGEIIVSSLKKIKD